MMPLRVRTASARARTVDRAESVRRLGGLVASATRIRRHLLEQVVPTGSGSDDDLAASGQAAGLAAHAFDRARSSLHQVEMPVGLGSCVEALDAWLDEHIAACDALTRAAGTRDRRHSEAARQHLRNAEHHAQRFNYARQLLVRQLAG